MDKISQLFHLFMIIYFTKEQIMNEIRFILCIIISEFVNTMGMIAYRRYIDDGVV